MKYYQWQDRGKGRRRRYTLCIYSFYPEEGPKGTPGRGPYCLTRIPIPADQKAKVDLDLAGSDTVQPLPREA